MNLKQSLAVDTTKFADEGLISVSREITSLKDYMRKHPKSLYATPQLLDAEDPKSIIVLRMRQKGKEILMTLINPVILATKDTIAVEETQDGIEGTYLNIRHPQLQVAFVGLPAGKPAEVTLSGKSALVFQQALRLTQGITIDMFGLRVDDYEEYQNADEDGKQEIVKNYIEALKEINSEMLLDDDTHEYVKATEFMAENAQRSMDQEFKSQLQDAYAEIKQAEEAVAAKKNNNNS